MHNGFFWFYNDSFAQIFKSYFQTEQIQRNHLKVAPQKQGQNLSQKSLAVYCIPLKIYIDSMYHTTAFCLEKYKSRMKRGKINTAFTKLLWKTPLLNPYKTTELASFSSFFPALYCTAVQH